MNDRERLIELIKYCADCPHPEEDFPCECCRYAKEKNCREAYTADHLIANGVTVQKHGRWERSDIPCENAKCSVCGGACWYYDCTGYVHESKYCPNCGAKMDEEEEYDRK